VNCDLNAERLKDERFEELCALAAIGELSASEFAELNEHLPGCQHCRELYVDFCRMASHDMGAVAAGRRYGDESIEGIDEAALLNDVLSRARQESAFDAEKSATQESCPQTRKIRFVSPFSSLLFRWTGVAASLLIAAFAAYEYGYHRHVAEPQPTIVTAGITNPSQRTNQVSEQVPAKDDRLQTLRAQRDFLQAALAEARQQYTSSLAQQKSLQSEIAAATEQVRKDGEDLQASKLTEEQSKAQIRELQSNLKEALAEEEAQARTLNELKNKLRQAEEEASVAAASGIQDADAKNLFGARDLHIVDVFDVDGSGKTKRAFGRVYYAEKRLLLFYAFDLQAKQNARRTAGFQAWGYRQGDEDKPRNLGLFLMDDPTVSRWVLKVNDARVLEHVDAVFVTLEPPNGSPSPSGRKLLYANLGGPPNHP
jgi:hypothetical protein